MASLRKLMTRWVTQMGPNQQPFTASQKFRIFHLQQERCCCCGRVVKGAGVRF